MKKKFKKLQTIKNRLLHTGSRAITHIPNCCMINILSLFTIVKIPGKQIEDNRTANEKIFVHSTEKSGFFVPGHFIENQNEWGEARFGLSTMKYSGCEIMAVYNALLDLGEQMTAGDMAELIRSFERKGAELQGRWGCSPRSIYKYFIRRKYKAAMVTGTNPDMINLFGETWDTVIITAYNDRNDIRKMIHTVTVTKGRAGSYILHNAYKQTAGKYTSYGRDQSLKNLQHVIGAISQGQAAPICIIGILRPDT